MYWPINENMFKYRITLKKKQKRNHKNKICLKNTYTNIQNTIMMMTNTNENGNCLKEFNTTNYL